MSSTNVQHKHLDKLHNKLGAVISQNDEINNKFIAQSLQIQSMSDAIMKLENQNVFFGAELNQLKKQQTDDQNKLNKRINDQQHKLLSFEADQELHAMTIEKLLDERQMTNKEPRETEEHQIYCVPLHK